MAYLRGWVISLCGMQTLGHVEFHTHANCVRPAVYPTRETLMQNWLNGFWPECRCKRDRVVDVLLVSEYEVGCPFFSHAKMCQRCHVLVDGWARHSDYLFNFEYGSAPWNAIMASYIWPTTKID